VKGCTLSAHLISMVANCSEAGCIVQCFHSHNIYIIDNTV